MKLNLVNDLGAPAAVTAVKMGADTWYPTWAEGLSYVAAAGGYLAYWQNMGGEFARNIGIASFPWAAEKLVNRVQEWTSGGTSRRPSTNKVALRKVNSVSRYPAPAFDEEFEGVRLD